MRAPRPWALLAVLVWLCLCGATARAADTGFTLVGATDHADVYLDGEKIGATPLPGALPCPGGEHTIRVVRPGYAPYIDVFKVRDGRVTRIEVELVPVSGVLRLAVNVDKARVFLDDQFVGEAPVESDLKIGPHKVRVARFGYREQTVTVNAVAGQVEELKLRLEELPEGANPYKPAAPPPPRWYERWWVWTAGAGAVAAIAVAVIVPVVYSTRSPCDRLGADVCIPVPAGAGQAALVGVRF